MKIHTLLLAVAFLVSSPSHAEVLIPVKAKVVLQKNLKVTYTFPLKMKHVTGLVKGRNFVQKIPIAYTRKKNTITIPLTALKSSVNYTFQVLGYKGKRVIGRSRVFKFRLSKVIARQAKNLTLHGVNAMPIISTLSSESGVDCTVTSDEVIVNKLSPCRFSFEPKDLRFTNSTARYQLIDTTANAERSDATITLLWNQTDSFVGNYQSIEHYRSQLTEDEARMLARWAGLGRNQDTIVATAMTQGLDAAVDLLLTPNTSGECKKVHDDAIAQARIERQQVCRTVRVGDALVNYCTPNTPQGKIGWTVAAMQRYWLYMLRYGCDPLRERMGLLFHNHFAVNLAQFQSSFDAEMFEHLEALRGEPTAANSITPNFESLVRRMHGDDALMLAWLNNNANAYNNITNQNYSRELMELFTLGALDPIKKTPNYSEQSVQELTKVLTGYQTVWVKHKDSEGLQACCDLTKAGCTPEVQCRDAETASSTFVASRWNDVLLPEKRYLFSEFAWGDYGVFKANGFTQGEDNVTPYLLYQHPGSSRYLATRLITTFATVEPTEAMVSKIAGMLVQDRYDLKRALKTILTSQSFYSSQAQSDCVAAPVENFISAISALDLPLTAVGNIDLPKITRDSLAAQGQALLGPDTVFGWQECGKMTGNRVHKGITWMGGSRGMARDKLMNVYLSELDKAKNVIGFKWSKVISGVLGQGRDATAVVNLIAKKLAMPLTQAERELLVEYFTTASLRSTIVDGLTVPDQNYTRRVNLAVLSDIELEKFLTLKIPGLIHILWSMEKSQVR